jgi:uncharacterized membrane protein
MSEHPNHPADAAAVAVAPAAEGVRNGGGRNNSGSNGADLPRDLGIDALRGLVMLLMALDHVRDHLSIAHFSPTDLTRTTPALFLTRWITHYCAPTFLLLSGIGAYLATRRGIAPTALGPSLRRRGLWLLWLEVTVVGFGWTFRLGVDMFVLQVIWAIGWSMIVLSFFAGRPPWVAAAFGVALIAGHNSLDGIPLDSFRAPDGGLGIAGWAFAFLHVQEMPIFYPLVPWCGVMALGYGLGPVFLWSPRPRRLLLATLGGLAVAGFLWLRGLNAYGEPLPWSPQASLILTALAFLNVSKYPPSLHYLLMTLGPALLLLAAWAGAGQRGPAPGTRGLRFLAVYGRVPLFFYILHIYLAHGLAVALGVVIGDAPLAVTLAPFWEYPASFGFPLPAIYGFWVAVVVVLLPVCLGFDALKARLPARWRWLA